MPAVIVLREHDFSIAPHYRIAELIHISPLFEHRRGDAEVPRRCRRWRTAHRRCHDDFPRTVYWGRLTYEQVRDLIPASAEAPPVRRESLCVHRRQMRLAVLGEAPAMPFVEAKQPPACICNDDVSPLAARPAYRRAVVPVSARQTHHAALKLAGSDFVAP